MKKLFWWLTVIVTIILFFSIATLFTKKVYTSYDNPSFVISYGNITPKSFANEIIKRLDTKQINRGMTETGNQNHYIRGKISISKWDAEQRINTLIKRYTNIIIITPWSNKYGSSDIGLLVDNTLFAVAYKEYEWVSIVRASSKEKYVNYKNKTFEDFVYNVIKNFEIKSTYLNYSTWVDDNNYYCWNIMHNYSKYDIENKINSLVESYDDIIITKFWHKYDDNVYRINLSIGDVPFTITYQEYIWMTIEWE